MTVMWPSPLSPLLPDGQLIGYARVSTENQKLDMQLDALQRAGCARIYYDHGVSGAKADRPGLDEALNTLGEGDTLVVYKLDRLGRSVLHLTDLISRLDNEGIQFCSLTEGIDTTTLGGKLVYHVFAAVSEFSRNLIRENTMAGLKAARERGSKIGRPHLLSDDDVIEAHRCVHQDGKSIREIAARFDVSESTIQRGIRRVGLDRAA
ncbi:recombinase family protein [Roseobacter litoralis]|uniref:Bacteriophage DNA-invertase n=1 Tax=Roseobacter litoralis (strain ATCC 49566 / DSM 6996 / JCM 21268 / NBRC 15278 / OCh 149) TaxID=391595 RepID=F7ZB95_ROSLO|nr:recombinase family protein [Roseobacter litoralis]AEI93088.1 bacteriophage DNA-invertase [Roseobacter litoralis Och 149]